MKIGNKTVTTFKMRNRNGYAAICWDCVTEGSTEKQAVDRMIKAITRVEKKLTKIKK